jgi:hypothetical protein
MMRLHLQSKRQCWQQRYTLLCLNEKWQVNFVYSPFLKINFTKHSIKWFFGSMDKGHETGFLVRGT